MFWNLARGPRPGGGGFKRFTFLLYRVLGRSTCFVPVSITVNSE